MSWGESKAAISGVIQLLGGSVVPPDLGRNGYTTRIQTTIVLLVLFYPKKHVFYKGFVTL